MSIVTNVIFSSYLAGNCLIGGCGVGSCCSAYGFCATTYCGGPVAVSCLTSGCPSGECCFQNGYCGRAAAYCGATSYGNCYSTGCAAGGCCTQYGYCGSYGAYCAVAKFLSGKKAASLEGEFQGQATYYNETMAGMEFSTCGTSRARSLDVNSEKIYTAALNQVQFDPYTLNGIPSTNPICQKKAIAKGIKGEIVVQFVDRCDGCKEGDIALTYDGFMAVAGELGDGHTDITWHFI
ncbi:unnamed protein product [Adineta steineri]|uniref:Chitin-binding type-1 domain-containing protein n=1 Tax=Adineta steineri TaxID=433720 RepID=A0A814RYH0_9BILA|nr:unnamed protein product [Adineta steineri]